MRLNFDVIAVGKILNKHHKKMADETALFVAKCIASADQEMGTTEGVPGWNMYSNYKFSSKDETEKVAFTLRTSLISDDSSEGKFVEKKGKKHEDCGCIFCNSICPECNSTDVKVTLTMEYHNDKENVIEFGDEVVHMRCMNCMGWFTSTEDERIDDLLNAIQSEYPNQATWKKGKIKWKNTRYDEVDDDK